MNLLYVCGYKNDIVGGVQTVVPEYIKNMSNQCNVCVLCLGGADIVVDGVYVVKRKKDLQEKLSEIDIVVFHEVYYFKFYSFAQKLCKMKKPYIVITHGSLTEGAQTQKKWAKKIFNLLWVNRFLANAMAVQFLSQYEKEQSKMYSGKALIIPNGINLVDKKKVYDTEQKTLKLLFVGRLSIYYKGLDLLVEACNIIKDFMSENKVSLDIYGTDFEGGKVYLQKKIKEYNLSEIITLHDGIFGEEKEKALLEHDVFVQPSRSEGQPMGILEALQYGLPVLITPGTTFQEVVTKYDCGWTAACTTESIAEGIRQVVKDKDQIPVKGMNAKNMSTSIYSWKAITKMTLDRYMEYLSD